MIKTVLDINTKKQNFETERQNLEERCSELHKENEILKQRLM